MKKENLIAYAMNFASFLLDDPVSTQINSIILFGSVARGNFDKESDIDIFIDTTKDIEKEAKKILSLFLASEVNNKWILKGLKNDISIKVGELKKWKLQRDIISDGIILYDKIKSVPEKADYYLLIRPTFKKFKFSKKVKLWRKLYGYKQKVGQKIYTTKGLVEKFSATRIENGILIPMKNKQEILDFFNIEKVEYTVNELWSDNF